MIHIEQHGPVLGIRMARAFLVVHSGGRLRSGWTGC